MCVAPGKAANSRVLGDSKGWGRQPAEGNPGRLFFAKGVCSAASGDPIPRLAALHNTPHSLLNSSLMMP